MGFLSNVFDKVAGPLVGGLFGAFGASQQNKASAKAAAAANEFSAEQADLQRDWASQEASTARQFNELQAQKQMDFQERLANSAHQREVADLRAAGLNPILSGTGGMGSATPVGSSAHASAPSGSSAAGQKADVVNVLGTAISSAISSALAASQVEKQAAETADVRSQTRFRDTSQVALTDAQIASHIAEQMLKSDQAALTRAQTERVVPEMKELFSRIELQAKQARESEARAGKLSEETKALAIDRFIRKKVMELDKSPIDGVPLDVVKGTLLFFLRRGVD